MADLWVKLSVNAPDDEKILEAGDHAELVYYRALCLAKRRNSDGVISRPHLRRLGASDDDVTALVENRLWSEIDRGWLIAGWFKHNDSAAEIEAKREGERRRKAEWRAKSRDAEVPPDATRDATITSGIAQSEEQSDRESESRVSVPPDATRDALLARLVARFRNGPNVKDVAQAESEARELLSEFTLPILDEALRASIAADESPYASRVRNRALKIRTSAPRPQRPHCATCAGTRWIGCDDTNVAIPCTDCAQS